MLELHIKDENTVIMSGRFDASQVGTAKGILDQLRGSCILDLAGVEYISSAGLGVLLALRQRLDQVGGTVTIRNMNKLVGDVFRYSRLDTVFTIE